MFTKTKMRETAEIERAAAAIARCQAEGHTAGQDEDEGVTMSQDAPRRVSLAEAR